MNRLSLKVKLTMLYTFFMILVTCAALAILFSLSSREVLSSTRAKLERQVQNSTDDVGLRDGVPAVNRDFYSVEDNVYLSLYDETGYFLLGRNPHGFDSRPEIRDGQVEIIRDGDTSWYVYDMSFRLSREKTVFIRGVTSVTAAEESYRVTLRLALILLPAMVLATAFIGYRFTRRTLLPVRRITATVQKIRADADLSRRVGVPESGGKNRDEICQLAETFDQMLAQLEEAFQREKQFTSDVSHELRTPVSVILAQCGECLSDETFTEDQKNQVRLIERKAREMSGMIGQLLFLSRADQGRQPLQKEELDLSELTQVITEEQQMVAAETDPEIEICREITPGIRACVDETLYIRSAGESAVQCGRLPEAGREVPDLRETDRFGAGDYLPGGGQRYRHPSGRPGEDLGTVLPGRSFQDRRQSLRPWTFHGAVDRTGAWGRDPAGEPVWRRQPVSCNAAQMMKKRDSFYRDEFTFPDTGDII